MMRLSCFASGQILAAAAEARNVKSCQSCEALPVRVGEKS
jgi:hypothetical protein